MTRIRFCLKDVKVRRRKEFIRRFHRGRERDCLNPSILYEVGSRGLGQRTGQLLCFDRSSDPPRAGAWGSLVYRNNFAIIPRLEPGATGTMVNSYACPRLRGHVHCVSLRMAIQKWLWRPNTISYTVKLLSMWKRKKNHKTPNCHPRAGGGPQRPENPGFPPSRE